MSISGASPSSSQPRRRSFAAAAACLAGAGCPLCRVGNGRRCMCLKTIVAGKPTLCLRHASHVCLLHCSADFSPHSMTLRSSPRTPLLAPQAFFRSGKRSDSFRPASIAQGFVQTEVLGPTCAKWSLRVRNCATGGAVPAMSSTDQGLRISCNGTRR
jgi:hypothetical protein